MDMWTPRSFDNGLIILGENFYKTVLDRTRWIQ